MRPRVIISKHAANPYQEGINSKIQPARLALEQLALGKPAAYHIHDNPHPCAYHMLWLPLQQPFTTALLLSICFTMGGLAALRVQLVPQFTNPFYWYLFCLITATLPLLDTVKHSVKTYWESLHQQDFQCWVTTQLAGETRLSGQEQAQHHYNDHLDKISKTIDELAKLYCLIAEDLGVVVQGMAYLCFNGQLITWQIFVLQISAYCISACITYAWQLYLTKCDNLLKEEKEKHNALKIPVHIDGSEADYQAWWGQKKAFLKNQHRMQQMGIWFKIPQEIMPAIATLASLFSFGELRIDKNNILTCKNAVIRDLILSQKLSETFFKALKHYYLFFKYKEHISTVLKHMQRLHAMHILIKINVSDIHITHDDRTISIQEMRQKIESNAKGWVSIREPRHSSRASLVKLIRMAYPYDIIWLPCESLFIDIDSQDKEKSMTDMVMHKVRQCICNASSHARKVIILDYFSNYLDKETYANMIQDIESIANQHLIIAMQHV